MIDHAASLRAEVAELDREIERERARLRTIRSKAHRASVRIALDAAGLRRAEIHAALAALGIAS